MADNPLEPETLEQMQARHRKEAKDLQGRITSKKKNATKKTRKGVNDECAEMERQMRERQAQEARQLLNGGGDDAADDDDDEIPPPTTAAAAAKTTTDEEVAARLDGLEPGAKPPQQPAQAPEPAQIEGTGGGGGGGGGKKRNRQKERLARRAAEQEAAAEAAEREAAGMTDRRGAERARMQAEFARRGLEEREIRPDGHCLFSAVADQLGAIGVPLGGRGGKEEEGEQEEGYRIVRRRAAGYIEAHGDEYAGFLEEDLGSYVRKVRDTAEWGGQLELLALASVYGVEIGVVQDREAEVVRPGGADVGGHGEGERKKIWLAYYRHGYGLGEHYNSLRKKKGVSE